MRARCSQLPVVERRPLVLKATEFQHFFEEGPTEKVYANTPLAGLGQTQQGKILQEWAKGVLQKQNPQAEISDPDLGRCCNGRRRGVNMAAYDFLMGGRRVEVKSSRMFWSTTEGRWNVQFSNIKLPYRDRTQPAFDDLYLVILSPRGMHLIKHDLVTGIQTCGQRTDVCGHVIKVGGNRRAGCWEDALDQIMKKLGEKGRCALLDERPFQDPAFKQLASELVSPGTPVVVGIPMSSMSRQKRGNRIQEIGLAIHRGLHPDSYFSRTGVGGNGARADWVRDTKSVELKSCVLTLDRSNNRWLCRFSWIKAGLFDELWLAIYTFAGIYFYRSRCCNCLGLSKTGVLTKTHGHQLTFCGPSGELDPLEALRTIKAKMFSQGCELVAIVEWEAGRDVLHDIASSSGD